MNYKIGVTRDNYHKAILTILNFNLKLSDLELTLISTLLKRDIKRVNTDSKEVLRKELNIDKYTLNNYIKRLKDKKILSLIDKDLQLDQGIIDSTIEPKVAFEFLVDDNN